MTAQQRKELDRDKAVELIKALDDRLARWYQSDKCDHPTLLTLEALRGQVREILRWVAYLEPTVNNAEEEK